MESGMPNRNSGLHNQYGVWVGKGDSTVQLYDSSGRAVGQEYRKTWFVNGNTGIGRDLGSHGASSSKPWLSMDKAFTQITAGNVEPGDRILFRGNINEELTTPLGATGITIEGAASNPQHADAHPYQGDKYAATWKVGSLGNNPLLILRYPGWTFKNILFAAHASNYAVRMERTAEDALTPSLEQDSSHAQFLNCRFASGGGGISDTGGTFNVKVYGCTFQALTTACILGVGNIGGGQLEWEIIGNKFLGFTNGVKILGLESIIEGNYFTDGGTPNTTFVLNLANGGTGRDNFIVRNFFQTATANFNTPDIVGNVSDVWAQNVSIDSTAAGVGGNFEWGQPA